MSNQSRSRQVTCANDCRQTGCPGHRVTLTYHHTSDTVTAWQDDPEGAFSTTFDRATWRALVLMDAQLRDYRDDAREIEIEARRVAGELAKAGWIEGIHVPLAHGDYFETLVAELTKVFKGEPLDGR